MGSPDPRLVGIVEGSTSINVTFTAKALVDVMGDHVPECRELFDDDGLGYDFWLCSCGWTEEDEVIMADPATMHAVAAAAVATGDYEMGSQPIPDHPIPVPSPNPIVSHVIDILVNGIGGKRINDGYAAGRVQ